MNEETAKEYFGRLGMKPAVNLFGQKTFVPKDEPLIGESAAEKPLTLDMVDESCLEDLNESEFWGNREYWRGCHTLMSDGASPSIMDKLKPKSDFEETYFSTHFGYSLSYALNLAQNRQMFKSLGKGTELVNSGSMTISLSSDSQRIAYESLTKNREYWWLVLLKIKKGTRIFHAYRDLPVLFGAMQNATPKMKSFVKPFTSETFCEKMKPLQTIDWYDNVHNYFPFNRKELLEVIRNYQANGNRVFHGYVNCEKGNYASIGLFNEHLSQSLTGPLYQVSLTSDKTQLLAKRCDGSVNASLPADSPPNASKN
jgi:hypothetical protein